MDKDGQNHPWCWQLVPINCIRPRSAAKATFGFLLANNVILNRPDISNRNLDRNKDLQQAHFVRIEAFNGFEVWRNRYSAPAR